MIETLLAVTVFGNLLAVVVSLLAFLKVLENAVRVEMLQKAPVLRQYVERFVPIDNSKEAQEKIQEKMREQERAFDESLGLVPPMGEKNKYAEHNILRAEELV